MAERVRRSLEANPIKTEAGDVAVTISMGVAVSTEAEPVDPHEMLRQADDALYAAKWRGRNRLELFDPSVTLANNSKEVAD